MKYFIQIIGANATGKSSIAGWILDTYESSASVGKYKRRQQQGIYAGGCDPLKATNQERREMVKELWIGDKDIVLIEGMIFLSNLNLEYFLQLQQEYYRKIIIVHLFCSLDTLQERIFNRSKGKPKNFKRTQNLITKSTGSARLAKYAQHLGHTVIQMQCDKIQAYDKIKEKLKELLNG